jgi:hypothetical protein
MYYSRVQEKRRPSLSVPNQLGASMCPTRVNVQLILDFGFRRSFIADENEGAFGHVHFLERQGGFYKGGSGVKCPRMSQKQWRIGESL